MRCLLAGMIFLTISPGGHAQIRELISGDYLIVYAITGEAVLLITIRHHRQLSFDLRAHWLS